MVELADLYPPTPNLDLTVELADLYPAPRLRVKHSRKERKRNQRQEEAPQLNETSSYLYAHNDEGITRYKEWESRMIFYAFCKHSLASSEEEAKDLVGEFLTWAIKENKLEGRTHKKVHFNWVQGTMFWQFLTRTREKQGQDALSRQRNKYSRTQQEKKKQKDFVYVPTTTANVFNSYDSEGNKTGSDMYYDEMGVDDQMSNECGWNRLYEQFELCVSDNKDAQLWTSILTEFLQGTFEGVSKTKKAQDEAWAKSHDISVDDLKSIRSGIFSILKKNKKIAEIAQEYFS